MTDGRGLASCSGCGCLCVCLSLRPAHPERACHGLQPVRLRAAAPVARAHDVVEERLRAGPAELRGRALARAEEVQVAGLQEGGEDAMHAPALLAARRRAADTYLGCVSRLVVVHLWRKLDFGVGRVFRRHRDLRKTAWNRMLTLSSTAGSERFAPLATPA